MKHQDYLGDRMKVYERVETSRALNPSLPVYARIDGRGFSKLTRDMERPYDERMSNAMIETTRYLVEKTHALIGYTQSDEISLVFEAGPNEGSDILFSGKIQKMTSVLAAQATAAFINALLETEDFRHYVERFPHFDARVFQLPNREEAAEAFLWRARDAYKNSSSMAARAYYSHSMLHKKTAREMREMLMDRGVDFEEYPEFFKRGTWLRRVTTSRALTELEWGKIPEKHRPSIETEFDRSEVKIIDMPDFNRVTNRVEVIFDGAEPVIEG